MDALIEEVYVQFKEKVEKGRDMDSNTVEKLARGRVWSGQDAEHLGLVDELGGFYAALTRARELAELDPEKPLTLVTYADLPGPDGDLRQTLLHVFGSSIQGPTLPAELQQMMVLQQLQEERVWMHLPYNMEVH